MLSVKILNCSIFLLSQDLSLLLTKEYWSKVLVGSFTIQMYSLCIKIFNKWLCQLIVQNVILGMLCINFLKIKSTNHVDCGNNILELRNNIIGNRCWHRGHSRRRRCRYGHRCIVVCLLLRCPGSKQTLLISK